jgi:voltage-dependent calcium channel
MNPWPRAAFTSFDAESACATHFHNSPHPGDQPSINATAIMSGASSVFPGIFPSPDSIPPAEVDSTLEMPDIFRGYSLFIFSPRIRNILCDVLVYPVTEPAILILIIAQLVFLVIENSANLFPLQDEQLPRWGGAWVDWALLSIWVIFTVDILCRIIVSGLLLGDIANANSLRATGDRIHTVEQVQRLQLARAPFLRHSFHRMDFIALISFWISIALSVTGLESQYHIRIFRTIGCLRILRLLALTNGTAVRLDSVHKYIR